MQKRNPGLDLARFSAIFLVMVSHTNRILFNILPLDTLNFLGSFGVELFFVLSGFLITTSLLDRSEEFTSGNLFRFIKRRWWRTLPNYYLFLLINFLAYTLVLGQADYNWKHLFFLQSVSSNQPYFFGESWSLCVEEWFYMLFPIIAFLVYRNQNRSKKILAALLILLSISIFLFSLNKIQFDPQWAILRKMTFCRLDAICFGGLLAYLVKNKNANYFTKIPIVTLSFFILFLGISLGIFYFKVITIATLLVQDFAAAAIILFLHNARVTSNKLILKISVWSYSMYLSHLLVETVINKFFETYSAFNCFVNLLAYFGITIIISAINYNFYESKLTALRPKF